MSGTDYILGLLTIVTGLAICEMIVSLHGLLINRRYVKWDWLAPLAACFVLLMIVGSWRITYVAFQDSVRGPPIWLFLTILLQNVALYLAARAVLPDTVDRGEPFDLRSYYEYVARYLWTAISAFYSAFLILMVLGRLMSGKMPFPGVFLQAIFALPVIMALAIWPKRKLHIILVPLLFIWLCIRILPARLLVV